MHRKRGCGSALIAPLCQQDIVLMLDEVEKKKNEIESAPHNSGQRINKHKICSGNKASQRILITLPLAHILGDTSKVPRAPRYKTPIYHPHFPKPTRKEFLPRLKSLPELRTRIYATK
jgi:hypothetical protein